MPAPSTCTMDRGTSCSAAATGSTTSPSVVCSCGLGQGSRAVPPRRASRSPRTMPGEGRASAVLQKAGEEEFRSLLSVPLILGEAGKLVGVLNVQNRAIREFREEEVAFLQTVASQVAIGLENARRYEQANEQLREKGAAAHHDALQRVSIASSPPRSTCRRCSPRFAEQASSCPRNGSVGDPPLARAPGSSSRCSRAPPAAAGGDTRRGEGAKTLRCCTCSGGLNRRPS